jgi:hypothetical protein
MEEHTQEKFSCYFSLIPARIAPCLLVHAATAAGLPRVQMKQQGFACTLLVCTNTVQYAK